MREGTAPVGSDKLIGFLMGGAAEHAWQQAQSNDLGVGEGWRIVVGASPSGLRGMGFEIIIHEDINLGHLVGDRRCYTVHGGSFPLGEESVVTSFYSKEKADLNFYIFSPFSTQDSGLQRCSIIERGWYNTNNNSV